jgi:pyridoxine 5-phosphate synthase
MICLSVNLNKVATLRNTRPHDDPSVVRAARTVLDAGAAGITVHPRPDARHIREQDVLDLAEVVKEPAYAGREYNIEGYPDDRFLKLIRRVKPDQVTLVPDAPDQATSDHGWDLPAQHNFLAPIIAELKELGCRVSLFADAERGVAEAMARTGADRIEIYTGPFFETFGKPEGDAVLAGIVQCATEARDLGLGVNAGHDLTLDNLPTLAKAVPWIDEVSIGHYLIGEALWMGFDAVVTAYQRCLDVSGTA